MKPVPIKRFMAFLLSVLLLFSSSMSVMAAGAKTVPHRGWIRAKLVYKHDEGVEGLSDRIIDFEDGWYKTGDWFYYREPVGPGDKVRFIKGFHVPAYWTEDLQNKKFAVIVTVEVSEAAPKDSGWYENTDILYSKTFDLWSTGYEHDDDVIIKEGKLDVDIHEYQKGPDGKETVYVNDKTIVPGQPVSKIVEFELKGMLGSNSWPEKVIEVIKTGQDTFLFVVIIGIALMTGTGYVLYKRWKEAG